MLLMVHGVGYYVMYINGCNVMYSNGVMQYLQMLLMIHYVGYNVMYSNGVMQYHTNASNDSRCWLLCYV